jgi:hypothetical protein
MEMLAGRQKVQQADRLGERQKEREKKILYRWTGFDKSSED